MEEKENISLQPSEERLYGQIAPLIRKARQQVATTVNSAMAYTNYNIGKYIVEDELDGIHRATYGKQVLEGFRLEKSKQEKFVVHSDTLDLCNYLYGKKHQTVRGKVGLIW